MSDNYEVLVVGGGPAGLAAGEAAARQEYKYTYLRAAK